MNARIKKLWKRREDDLAEIQKIQKKCKHSSWFITNWGDYRMSVPSCVCLECEVFLHYATTEEIQGYIKDKQVKGIDVHLSDTGHISYSPNTKQEDMR